MGAWAWGAGCAGDAADDAVFGDHAGLGQEPDAQAPEDACAGGPGGRRGERAHQREHQVRSMRTRPASLSVLHVRPMSPVLRRHRCLLPRRWYPYLAWHMPFTGTGLQ